MDLLGLVKDQLTSSVVGKISSYLGESSTATQSALGGAVPAILSGLIQQSATPQGAGQLLNTIKTGGYDGSQLGGLADMFGDSNKVSNMTSMGGNLLSGIFGNKLSGLISTIGNISGLGQGSTSSLLSIAAPIIMSVLGKHVTSQGLGASGLSSLLSSQESTISKALPTGLSSMFSSVGNAGKAVVNQVQDVAEDTSNGIGKFLPWILLGALLLGALYYWKSCKNTAENVVAAVDSTATSTASAVGAVVDSTAGAVKTGLAALGDFFKFKLPNGVELNIPQNGIENHLIEFIGDKNAAIDKEKWFNFDRINFETGKSSLSADSKEQVKNIAEIMKAFPALDIKIGGYTDNTGDAKANMKLSADRAKTVMGAIVAEGIGAKRLTSEGYGDAHPEATNDTEEGRAQNRRIAVRVTKK